MRARAPAQLPTATQQACDGQSDAASQKIGVHHSGCKAAGRPNCDRPPLDHLLKLLNKVAPMQRPRHTRAGRPTLPLKTCKHGETKQEMHDSAWDEPSASDTAAARRRKKPAAELETYESAWSYPSAHDVERRIQRGKRPRLHARQAAGVRSGAARRPQALTFETRLATLREGWRARTKKSNRETRSCGRLLAVSA